MKLALVTLLASLAASSAFATSGTILVQDDFEGSSLDTTEWQALSPFFFSNVEVSDGAANLYERGTIATQEQITAPYAVNGVFRINDSSGMFSVSLRSDLSTEENYGAATGITVSFVAEFDTVQIHTLAANGSTVDLVPTFSYAFDDSTDYSFEITDDGSNLSLAINGTTVATGFSSTFATGAQVAFYSRETPGSSASLQSVTITTSAVPEPASFAALAGLGVLGLAAARRRRAA